MADELIGKRIGGYEIIEVIGRGGMAVVYRAHQISMNRAVAMKILPRQFLNDETYMQRFNREVQIVAQLEHRNIVPVHDYGEADGQPYIVMRYMDGGSVDDVIRRGGSLSMAHLLNFVSQIAPALDYAHSKGVLHRDLKPSNILLDDNGGAYLTDFGIARLMGDAQANISAVTTQGVIGTPSYMSPEQAQGKPLDGRSDLYSLGISMFEMATGTRPFEGDTPYSIAVLQVTAHPPEPRTLNTSIPVSVERVILKSMSKQAADRYPTAVALAEALALAIASPDIPDLQASTPNMMDTQPGFRRPEMPPPMDINPTPAPTPMLMVPNYASPPPPSYGTPMGSSSIPRVRPRRRGSLLTSIMLGAVMGCGLLTVLAVIAAVIITTLTSESPTATPADLTATGSDATNTVVASTIVPTRTSAASTTQNPPVQSPTDVDDGGGGSETGGIDPIGSRPTPTGIAGFGAIVFFAEREGNFDIYRLDLTTRLETRLTNDPGSDMYGAISPDGSRIAFQSDRDGDFDIYVMNSDGSGTQRVTDNNITDRIPTWTPDGLSILFSSDTRGDGTHDLYEVQPNGENMRLLYSDGGRNSHPRVSGDGRYVVFTSGRTDDASTWDIKRIDLTTNEVVTLTSNTSKDWSPTYTPAGDILYLTDGLGYAAIARMDANGANSRVIYDGSGYEWGAQVHPDQRGIVFNSDVTGRDELYLMDMNGGNIRRLTELGGAYGWWVP